MLSSPHHALAVWSDTRNVISRYHAMALPAEAPVAGVPDSPPVTLELTPIGVGREIELRLSATGTGDVEVTLFDVSGRRRGQRRVTQNGATDTGRAFLIR